MVASAPSSSSSCQDLTCGPPEHLSPPLVWSLVLQNKTSVSMHFCLFSVTLFSSCNSYLLGIMFTIALRGSLWYLGSSSCFPPPCGFFSVWIRELCPPILVSFGFYHFLPLLISPCALRFYLSGFKITAFSTYMIRAFFCIPNNCWPCSIT